MKSVIRAPDSILHAANGAEGKCSVTASADDLAVHIRSGIAINPEDAVDARFVGDGHRKRRIAARIARCASDRFMRGI